MTVNAGEDAGKMNPFSQVVEMETGIAIMEVIMEVSQNIKNRTYHMAQLFYS